MNHNALNNKYTIPQFDEAYKILKKRFSINKIDNNIIKDKLVLNLCDPSGRYTYALNKLGAKKVYTYNETEKPKNWIDNFFFLKIDDNLKFNPKIKFDFIFCNGVLSHKKNWKTIIKNLSKFLNKDGHLWLSLYANGKHWMYADKFKKNLKQNNFSNFKKALELRSWESNKINFLIDLFFKNRIYFEKKEIKNFLNKNKFNVVKFLERGIPTDLNEMIFQNKNLTKIYGNGEIRLIAKKGL